MFLSIALALNLNESRMVSANTQFELNVPVVVGKKETPTPTGIFLLSKAINPKLGRLLVFQKDDGAVWAIHENLPSRSANLESASIEDNFVSAGCIGVDESAMNQLWNAGNEIVLQIYEGKKL